MLVICAQIYPGSAGAKNSRTHAAAQFYKRITCMTTALFHTIVIYAATKQLVPDSELHMGANDMQLMSSPREVEGV